MTEEAEHAVKPEAAEPTGSAVKPETAVFSQPGPSTSPTSPQKPTSPSGAPAVTVRDGRFEPAETMTYEETLSYIHSLSRFGMKPGLERIRALLGLIGDPQDALSCVHVAGTNGKGSTSTMLACGLAGAGYTVGLYTSPYVLDFRERIQTVSYGEKPEMISREDLARTASILRPYAESISERFGEVTEFEFITALAFFSFAERGTDVCVIETGLGGRLDATNVIKEPLCSVITSIGLDHTDILGDTLAKIAGEKCGIIKEDCPVVTCFGQETEAMDVIFDACTERSSPLAVPEEGHLRVISEDLTGSDIEYFGKRIRVPFAGRHQINNCLTALTAAFVLRDRREMRIHNDSFIQGLESASMPARQELLRSEPPLILDGSHNPDGLEKLFDTVERFIAPGGKPKKGSLLVIGMLRDKDVRGSAGKVAACFERIITVTPDSPRAMEASELADIIRAVPGAPEKVTPMDVKEAAAEAKSNAGPTVVCGSLYLAAEIRPLLI